MRSAATPKTLQDSLWGRVVRSASCSVEPFVRSHRFPLFGEAMSSTAVGGVHRIAFGLVVSILLQHLPICVAS